MYMYEVQLSWSAERELEQIRPFDRNLILDTIEDQLTYAPMVETRNRKMLATLMPSFEHVPPVWQLRAGDYRVFYDVDEEEKIVIVRAIRLKPAHKTTEGIL